MAEGRKAVLQVERRTWDTEEYQRRADERREEEERLEKEVRARSEHHFVRAHPQAHAYLTARRVCWEQKEDAAAGKKPMGGAIVRRDPLNKDRC